MLKYQKITIIVSGIITLILLSMLFIVQHNEWRTGSSVDIGESWHYADGSPADISGMIALDDNSEGSVFYNYSSAEHGRLSLCFRSHNVLFSVYADDSLIYSFHPELGGIYGTCYGDCIHTVSIPVDKAQIELRVHSLKDDSWDGFYDIVLQEPDDYIRHLPSFIVCAAAFFVGMVLFIGGLTIFRWQHQMIETICLGVLTMLLSVWCHSQVRVLHIIVPNPLMIRAMDYLALELTPIPMWIYVASFINNLKHPVTHIVTFLCTVHFAISFTATIIGAADYGDFLITSHILICFCIAASIWLITDSIRKKKLHIRKSIYLIVSFLVVAICSILDFVRYYILKITTISTMSRIGLALFVIILTYYELQTMIRMHITTAKAELMQKLAMEDVLTGLGSRTAFTEFENSLKKRSKGKCLFIHFDVNNLKKVNDNYGHAEGDKFIRAAADILKDSFGKHGHCFRVGGDEFFVILDGKKCDSDYKTGLVRFDKGQKKYNETGESPVPLHIAYGIAEYDMSDGSPESAERLADSRMYEKKKQMKIAQTDVR